MGREEGREGGGGFRRRVGGWVGRREVGERAGSVVVLIATR